MEQWRAVLQLVVLLAQVVGIPVAIALFAISKRRERKDLEYGTFNALDDKYIEYLRLCLANADLDVFDVPNPAGGPLNEDQEHRERVMFSILLSILERSYLMYRDKSKSVRKKQWVGWDAYARSWCERANVRRVWQQGDAAQFDRDFVAYLEKHFAAATTIPPGSPPNVSKVPERH